MKSENESQGLAHEIAKEISGRQVMLGCGFMIGVGFLIAVVGIAILFLAVAAVRLALTI